jgi:hypothetical protein
MMSTPAHRKDSTTTTGFRWISISRNPDDPFGTTTAYADCPACLSFATVFRDERGVWSLCHHVGDPRHPLDDFEARLRLRELRDAA